MILEQTILPPPKAEQKVLRREDNKLQRHDRAAHQWYRFVLSFPPHLVRDYIKKFELDEFSFVLDPFCGTGTTLVECQKLGIQAVGLESNPVACFASCTKLNWQIEPVALWEHAQRVAMLTDAKLEDFGLENNRELMLLEVA